MMNAVRRAWTYMVATGVVIFLVSACSRGGTDTPPDTASPTVPTSVQATTLSPNVIMLTWSPSSDDAGVKQYEVYVGGVPIVSLPSTTTMFLYSDLTPSTEYCCTVRAIDAAGNESALSDPPACATTISVADTIPPAVPTGLSGAASQNKIALSWNASPDAVNYNVFKESILVGSATVPNFVDTGLTASTPYCYAVSAVDAAGNESVKSAPACITTLSPPETTVPAVIATFPLNNATNVQTDPFMATATFSEPMNMTSVIMSGRFTLSGTAGLVPGIISYDIITDSAKFMPSLTLASGAVYTAIVSRDVQDAAGNFMRFDYAWSFTTAATPTVTYPTVIATDPANNESSVVVNTVITAQFWEPIDGTTVMAASNFICATGQGNGVPGLVSYDANTWTALFTPSASLMHATIYTCRILKNVTDQAGHGMLDDYVWSFMTMP